MQPVLPATAATPLYGTASTRRIEAAMQAVLPQHTLMRRAGLATARLALALTPHAILVWIATGPGNNGGDGWEAAFHLQTAGKNVRVTPLPAPGDLPPDALDARQRALAAGVTLVEHAPPLQPGDLAIDALLGIGATRAPSGLLAERILQLNTCGCTVLSVDLPSGLCADTGRLLGDTAVRASHTLSLLTLKPGLFTAQGRDHAGVVFFDGLGQQTAELPDARLIGLDSCHSAAPNHSAHKGSQGDTLVVGGAHGMSGAALLAARAALAAGSGRVYVSLLDEPTRDVDSLRPELMLRPTGWPESKQTLERCTVVVGCGGGDAVAAALPRLLSSATRLVVDADALNAVGQDSMLRQLLQARSAKGLATVLTPHPLETARLLGCSVSDVQASRLTAATQLAEQMGAIVVLKGSGTVVATPKAIDAAPWINGTGNAALATAGTGDVLAGWLAGLWAVQSGEQDRGVSTAALALQVSKAAVCLHGLAADRAGIHPLRAGELVEMMLAAANRAT